MGACSSTSSAVTPTASRAQFVADAVAAAAKDRDRRLGKVGPRMPHPSLSASSISLGGSDRSTNMRKRPRLRTDLSSGSAATLSSPSSVPVGHQQFVAINAPARQQPINPAALLDYLRNDGSDGIDGATTAFIGPAVGTSTWLWSGHVPTSTTSATTQQHSLSHAGRRPRACSEPGDRSAVVVHRTITEIPKVELWPDLTHDQGSQSQAHEGRQVMHDPHQIMEDFADRR